MHIPKMSVRTHACPTPTPAPEISTVIFHIFRHGSYERAVQFPRWSPQFWELTLRPNIPGSSVPAPVDGGVVVVVAAAVLALVAAVVVRSCSGSVQHVPPLFRDCVFSPHCTRLQSCHSRNWTQKNVISTSYSDQKAFDIVCLLACVSIDNSPCAFKTNLKFLDLVLISI